MCLSNFEKFIEVEEKDAIIGYRTWRNLVNSLILKSQFQNYTWSAIEGPHEVKVIDSGIYAYNYYYNNNNNNNDYYQNNNYYYYHNNNYNYYYNINGIIKQYGKIAIHKIGQRSEYAKIDSLFSIRESDAQGPKEFINWTINFNKHIYEIANKYNCNVIPWQDFVDAANKEVAK